MDGFGLQGNDFAYAIVILAAVLHLFLIITVIICSCCKERCSCLDVTYEDSRRSNRNNRTNNSNNVNNQHILRLPDYNESEAQSNLANDNLVQNNETRTVTSWHTSLLTRIQARIGLSRARDPPEDAPPDYRSHNFPEWHSNPGCDEDNDLPPYSDHSSHLPPWYVAMEAGSEDKPPLYEEVVMEKNK